MEQTPRKILTLCVVNDGSRVLLGMKKRGFGMGRWNGFGGKVTEGETIERAALRELHEEAGIKATNLEKRGLLTFAFEGDPQILEVHVFAVPYFTGVPSESEEMQPQWFSHRVIPFDAMWPDDKHWFPLLLAGKNFKGEFNFRGMDTILNYQLKEV